MRHVRCIRSSGARAVRCSKGDRCCCCRPSVFEAVRANQGDLYQLPCRGSHEFFPQVKVGCRCRPPTPLPPTLPRTFLSLPPSTHLLPPPPTTTITSIAAAAAAANPPPPVQCNRSTFECPSQIISLRMPWALRERKCRYNFGAGEYFVFNNNGGVRAGLSAGPIYDDMLRKVTPYKNRVRMPCHSSASPPAPDLDRFFQPLYESDVRRKFLDGNSHCR